MKELNLIPYSLKERKQKAYNIRQYAAYAVIFVCVLFMGLYIPNFMLKGFKLQEQYLQKEIDKNKAVVEENKSITDKIESYNNRIKVIQKISENKITAEDKIKIIEKYIPQDVNIKNLSYNRGSITIEANCKNYNSASEFAANLEMSKMYKSARLINILKDTSGTYYAFNIYLQY